MLRLSALGRVGFLICQSSTACDTVQANTYLSAGVWYHVAGVYDGSQSRVYVNGVLDGSLTNVHGLGPGTGNLKIGARALSDLYFFNGQIDEARVTAAALYTSNFTPQRNLSMVNGTRGLWKFDAQNPNDSSGFGTHGILNGGATFSINMP